jgi:hypothetical protein
MIAKGMSLNDAGFWITKEMKWRANEPANQTDKAPVNP